MISFLDLVVPKSHPVELKYFILMGVICVIAIIVSVALYKAFKIKRIEVAGNKKSSNKGKKATKKK